VNAAPAAPPRTQPLDSCPICGAATRSAGTFMEVADRWLHTPGRFRYVRCPSCQTVHQSPQVLAADLGTLYPGSYFTHLEAPVAAAPSARARGAAGLRDRIRGAVRAHVLGESGAGAAGRLLAHSRRLRERAFHSLPDELIPRRLGLRALDVGCGAGELLARLMQAGYVAEGLDFDPLAAAAARALSGALVHSGAFEKAPLAESSFDLVVLSHSFEHLPQPRAALRRIASLLRPGGRAVLLYPNPRSLGAWWFGTAWHSWDPPRHLTLPPPAAIRALGAACGLRCVTRTRNQRAAAIFAASRALRGGFEVDAATASAADRAIAVVSGALVAAGAPAGEELVVTLTREAQ
jgi:SAM-dependent methyltransferase